MEAGNGIGDPDGPSATNKLMAGWSELSGEKSNSFLVSRPDHDMIPKFVHICMAALLDEVEKEAKSLRKSMLCSRGVFGLEVVIGELLKGEALKLLIGLLVPAWTGMKVGLSSEKGRLGCRGGKVNVPMSSPAGTNSS